LKADTSTFSLNPEEKSFSNTNGAQLTLVSGYQSKNNHRAIFTGSMSVCSDELMATDGLEN